VHTPIEAHDEAGVDLLGVAGGKAGCAAAALETRSLPVSEVRRLASERFSLGHGKDENVNDIKRSRVFADYGTLQPLGENGSFFNTHRKGRAAWGRGLSQRGPQPCSASGVVAHARTVRHEARRPLGAGEELRELVVAEQPTEAGVARLDRNGEGDPHSDLADVLHSR
jgi:hypothetical protein